jgi:signal transduction histidine kinase
MENLFKKIPLSAKLMVIGLVPLLFIVILARQIYSAEVEKIDMLGSYKTSIEETAQMSKVMDELQNERRLSFDFLMHTASHSALVTQRNITDTAVQRLEKSKDSVFKNFSAYSFLNTLPQVRLSIDTGHLSDMTVMYDYTNIIYRLSTLNQIPSTSWQGLQPIKKDLIGQQILSQMITFLNIMRSNIYNVLYTKQNGLGTLYGMRGSYDMYKSYEIELASRASFNITQSYKNLRNKVPLRYTIDYIDTLYKTYTFPNTYSADRWWNVSGKGVDELHGLQQSIWRKTLAYINAVYANEQEYKNRTLIFLTLTVLFVIIVIAYILHVITKTLNDLKNTAQKIAKGETGLTVRVLTTDAIGSLAKSISEIDDNYKALSDAASSIGKGNFNVEIHPRGPHDVLANALIQMKKDLQQYTQENEQSRQQLQTLYNEVEKKVIERTKELHFLNEELKRSNRDLAQFAYVASHDLQEPLRKIQTFAQYLKRDQLNIHEASGKHIEKIAASAERMRKIIDDLLAYAQLNADKTQFKQTDLNDILKAVINDLELLINQKRATLHLAKLPVIECIPIQMNQLFYNLINNALKFSSAEKQPNIDISFKELSVREFEIIVKDNGIGFEQDYALQIFNMFQRLNSSVQYSGTGIGLALCKKITENHKGSITAESEINKGTAFTIRLPYRQTLDVV